MQNIPMFTTEKGIAALTLKQIPQRGSAFINFGASGDPEALLRECAGFCKACGAEKVYASGFPGLEAHYPLHCRILEMQIPREMLLGVIGELQPVQTENSEKWRRIYNEKMDLVDHAAYLDFFDMKQMLRDGDCFFIQEGEKILGIGKASGDTIFTLASLQAGAGETILRTLAGNLMGDVVRLEVASTNKKAISLYQRLGFRMLEEKESWYKII